MTSRNYSSFLLRFWLTGKSNSETETTNVSQSLVLQLQHLQTGTIWRLNSLEELNNLLGRVLVESLNLTPLDNLESGESLANSCDLGMDF